MIDLSIELVNINRENKKAQRISLCGKLEGIVGNYFVRGAGVPEEWPLQTIFYDSEVDSYTEKVKLTQENIVAFVDANDKWAFVLNKHMEKFKEDTAEYGIKYVGVESFREEVLCCSAPDLLPEEFQNLRWIDDDFMSDETIPFDFEAFAEIDEGVEYLNPKHFSVMQLYLNFYSK